MRRKHKKYFLLGLLSVLAWSVIDGILLYAGFDGSHPIVNLLEFLFG